MENQSIEDIWKKGFLNQDQLIAPKVNDLYNQKSIHVIDQFKQRFLWNIRGIVIAGVIVFALSLLIGAAVAGAIICVLLLMIAWLAKQDQESLNQLDKGQSSYVYLKGFKDWIEQSIEKYGRLYRYVYPALILTFYFGLWFSDIAAVVREKVVDAGQELIWGIHPTTTIIMVMTALTMSFLSKRIHREDVGLVYGSIMRRLEELINEMEDLKGEHE